MSVDELQQLLDASQPALAKVFPKLVLAVTTELIPKLWIEEKPFGAFQGWRSLELQKALFAQGRLPLAQVNELRAAAGEPPLQSEDENFVVTKLKIGWHNFGLAVDLVEDGDPSKAGIQWSWKAATDYLLIGAVVKEIKDLAWGGFWKAWKDYPHVEMTGGLTLAEATTLYAQGGLDAVWAEVEHRLAGTA